MARLINRHQILFIMAYTMVFIVPFLIITQNLKNAEFGLFLGYVAFITISVLVIAQYCLIKELSQGLLYLNRDCNPEEYLKIINDHLSIQFACIKAHKPALLINKTACLSALGQYDESLKIL